MSQKLPTAINSLAFDHQVAQALDRYKEMSPEEAHQAIVRDWHEQMAAIIELAVIAQNKMRRFHEQARADGSGTYIFIPLSNSKPKTG